MKRASSRMQGRARDLRKNLTLSERRIWGWLRDRSLAACKFRRQVAVDRFVLDFYCAELRLAIEIDGAQHREGWVAEIDSQRTRALRRLGIVVVRIDNVLIAKDPLTAARIIECALQQRMAEREHGPLRLQ